MASWPPSPNSRDKIFCRRWIEKKIIKNIIEKGAVDGVSGKAILAVDNFDLNKNAWALTELNKLKPNVPYNMLSEKGP